jgi:hypothetical protein
MTRKRLNKFIHNLSLWILICIKALLCICSFLFLSRCLFYDPVRIFDNPEYLIIFTTWGFQFFWAYKFIRSIALYINSNLKRYPSVLKTDLKILCLVRKSVDRQIQHFLVKCVKKTKNSGTNLRFRQSMPGTAAEKVSVRLTRNTILRSEHCLQ